MMSKFIFFVSLGLVLSIISSSNAEVCDGAKVDAVGYTTNDATIVSKIAYIADFTLTCSNGIKDVVLYAETSAGIIGVARAVDGVHYQVSWTEDSATASSGDILINLYDDQSYAALRKVQRSGEDSSSVSPIASINLYHSKAYNGPWVHSETVAVLSIIGIYYYALVQKNIITE